MPRSVVISIVVVLLGTICFTMVGCERTDERLYGRWEASVELNWGNNGGGDQGQQGGDGNGFRNRMTPAEREAMEQRLANRKAVFEFTTDGQWTYGIDFDDGSRIPPLDDTRTFSIKAKDEKTATVDLLEYEFVMHSLTIRYDDNGGFKMEGFQGEGPRMNAGTFTRVGKSKTE